jgi:Phospholipase_D-nuclease N-terminal
MARLSIVLFLAEVVLAVLALISCLSAEDQEIRALPRLVWVLIILLLPLVGSIAWFLAGRPRAAVPGGGATGITDASPRPRMGPTFGERRPTVGPDDSPDFLRSLDDTKASRDRDRELFEQWEQELKRRNDDPPQPPQPQPPQPQP